jgi:cysteine desulfurase
MSRQKLIYLDHAAATPIDGRVVKAMEPYFSRQFFNPSATYTSAIQVRKDLEAARAQVAFSLGARTSEIIFTAGGSEANNLAIHGVMRRHPKSNIVISCIEHESVLAPAAQYEHRLVKVDPLGRLDLKDLEKKIDEQTVLVSIMQANNEIGTIEPIKEIAQVINRLRQKRVKPLYFHTDACQAANYLDLHVSRLGVDLMTLNGGKIYGPKQSGALYIKAGLELTPLIDGGGQERGLRSGTENAAAAIGFSEALKLTQSMRHEEVKRLSELQKQFIDQLTSSIQTVSINGSLKYRLPNNVHITLPGQDNERLLIELDERGVLAAAGSACSASSEEASHVLKALDLSEAEARSSLRLTLGRETKPAELKQVTSVLAELVNRGHSQA